MLTFEKGVELAKTILMYNGLCENFVRKHLVFVLTELNTTSPSNYNNCRISIPALNLNLKIYKNSWWYGFELSKLSNELGEVRVHFNSSLMQHDRIKEWIQEGLKRKREQV